MTLTLVQYPPALGTRSASPFCIKMHALLKLSGLPFEVENWDDPRRAPKKKLPAVRDGDALVGDSSFIRKHLEERHGVAFDAHLSASEKAIGQAFARMCDEHLYWAIVHTRWWMPEHWPATRDAYFANIPALVKPIALIAIRKEARKQIDGHGMGRHSHDEIISLGTDDLRALSEFLGEKEAMMGDTPSTVDASVFGHLHTILDCTMETPLKAAARNFPNLVAYTERMGAFFYAE